MRACLAIIPEPSDFSNPSLIMIVGKLFKSFPGCEHEEWSLRLIHFVTQ